MDRQPTNIPIDENRLSIRRVLVPQWSAGDEVQILPLAWGRQIHVRPADIIEAWAVIKHPVGPEDPDHARWDFAIREAENRAQESDQGRDIWQLRRITTVTETKGKNTIWRVNIPIELRNMGVFPIETGQIVGLQESIGISVWYRPALAFHIARLFEETR